MNILDKIVAEKLKEVAVAKEKTSEAVLRPFAEERTNFTYVRDFQKALRQQGRVSLIAEVKKASPSAGVICDDFEPVTIAKQYQHAGASACSVLTDQKFFQGHLS